jgi:hypothetical protein
LKPVGREALYAALNLAVEKMRNIAERSITTKTRDGLRTLDLDCIVCCEYISRRVRYVLLGEQIEIIYTDKGVRVKSRTNLPNNKENTFVVKVLKSVRYRVVIIILLKL